MGMEFLGSMGGGGGREAGQEMLDKALRSLSQR